MEVRGLTDGRFGLDGGAMFGVVPKVLWERVAPADERNRIRLSLRCLLVEGRGRRILLDAGIGEKWDERGRDMYAIDHGAGELCRSLAALGVAPEEITDVVVSHLHFDHAGGLTRREGTSLRPTFPSARVHTQRAHWEWAHRPSEKDRASFVADDYGPIEAAGRITLHEGDYELCPGVVVRAGQGHTVGHQVVIVHGDGDGLVFSGDTIPTAAHLRVPWVMGYDLHPLATLEEKKALLAEVERRGWVLAFDHEPDFPACRLRRNERGEYAVGEKVFL